MFHMPHQPVHGMNVDKYCSIRGFVILRYIGNIVLGIQLEKFKQDKFYNMEETEKSKLVTNAKESIIKNKTSSTKGIAAMLGYVFFTSTSRVCVQMLEKAVPDFELNAIRCGFTLPCMGVYFAVKKIWPTVKRENWISVGLLCFFNNISSLALYISVTLIPLASSESCTVTFQIISSLVIFTIINKERITWDKLLAVPVCSTGVLLVLQPTFLFGHQGSADSIVTNLTDHYGVFEGNPSKEMFTKSTILSLIGYLLAALHGITSNMLSSITKYDRDFYTNENILISVTWANISGTIFSVILMAFVEEATLPSSVSDTFLVTGHAFAYVLIVPIFVYGSLLISGSLSAIIRSLNLLFVLAAQYLLMKDTFPGHRNWAEVFGVILVLFGAIFSSVVEVAKNNFTGKDSN